MKVDARFIHSGLILQCYGGRGEEHSTTTSTLNSQSEAMWENSVVTIKMLVLINSKMKTKGCLIHTRKSGAHQWHKNRSTLKHVRCETDSIRWNVMDIDED